LQDGDELVVHGTDPNDPDTDDDGLSDGKEASAQVIEWGQSYTGQDAVARPASLTNLTEAAAGWAHVVARRHNGTVACWGKNDCGQCVPPADLTNVAAVAAGASHSAAVRSDGTVVCWGDNSDGQCVAPAGLGPVKTVAAGMTHTAALTAEGGVVCWGHNLYGQCAVPAGLTGVVSVAAGSFHTVALRADGGVVCWGYNASGQTNAPVDLTNAVTVAAGMSHTVALRRGGTVACWGSNSHGQTDVPTNMASVVKIGAGKDHTLAYADDGRVVCWGDNSHGQCETLSPTGTVVSLGGGDAYSLAVVRSTDPLDPDTDGDGLTDGDEVLVYGTDPLVPDTDGDGLTDGDEVNVYGTDPLVPEQDGDGDGLWDAWEICWGFDPYDPADGVLDGDGDGFDNLQEQEMGGNPSSGTLSGSQLCWLLAHHSVMRGGEERSLFALLGGAPDPVGLRVDVQDDDVCGDPQIVVEPCDYGTLDAPGYILRVTVSGRVEDVDDGFDMVWLQTKFGTETIGDQYYFQGHDGVPYGEEVPDPPPMVGEQASRDLLFLNGGDAWLIYDTVDARYHRDCYAEVTGASVVQTLKFGFTADVNRDGQVNFMDDGAAEDTVPGLPLAVGGTGGAKLRLVLRPLDLGVGLFRLSVLSSGAGRAEILDLSGSLVASVGSSRTWTLSESAPLSTVPSDLIVRGTHASSASGDVTLKLEYLTPYGQTVWSDTITVTLLRVEMTAYRPTTEGPAYNNPFQRREIPEAQEETPGAGIRVNGDDDNVNSTPDRNDTTVNNENDLIEVVLDATPPAPSSGFKYVLKRSASNIKVWTSQNKTTALLDANSETNLTFSTTPMTVWVENPNGGNADLELQAKTDSGTVVCSDKVHFYPFTSVVIVFGGEFQDVVTDPPPAGAMIYSVATRLFQDGYDAHMYVEPDAGDPENSEDTVFDEIVSAVNARQVTGVAVLGYSHGGGSTWRVANRLNTRQPPIGLQFSAYVDAVTQGAITQENRRPPGSAYHANYYQEGSFADGGLDGGPIDDPPGADHQVNLDDPTATETHTTIDDEPAVLDDIVQRLTGQLNR
jgi:hypothetical protein